MASAVGVGDQAPDFTLPTQSGETVTLSDLRGKIVVLYFYPKDETRGCTAQACALRDAYEDFTDAGAQVIGVSSDSVSSHEKFAQHHQLPFLLAADAKGAVRQLYGVKSSLGIIPGRTTYVIDGEGIIRHVFSAMGSIGTHVQGALQVVKELARDAASG